jgi:hypothetical protein
LKRRRILNKSKSKKPKSEEEPKEDREDENQEDAEFVLSATRAPRQGAYEQLLSQFLAQAVICTDPLKRVKVVCEAALMIPESERTDLTIDYDKIDVLNRVTNALLYCSTTKRYFCNGSYDVAFVSWGFHHSEENFNKYIAPWIKNGPTYWPQFMQKHVVWAKTYSGFPKIEKMIYEPLWDFFFDASLNMTLEGLTTLRNEFAAWAIPKVQQYLAELTGVVSPSLYSQILGLYTKPGKKDYAEKVKEVAKETVGEETAQ